MEAFENREAGFEKRLEVDETLRFKSLARRNKLIGLWVAEKRGLDGAAAQDYAGKLVEAQVGRDDDEALAKWIEDALGEVRPEISAHRIRRRIQETTATAAKEVFEGR